MRIESIDSCKVWFQEQIRYREQLQHLFVRQWILAGSAGASASPTHTVEAYAQHAFQAITNDFFQEDYRPEALEPRVKTDKIVHEDGFAVKVLADGWTLVKTGPRADSTAFGSGECGACPRAELTVYAISPKGEWAPALNIYEVVGRGTSQADFTFSDDWQTATYYSEAASRAGGDDTWTATRYCLQGHVYEPCGHDENVQPPNPPGVLALRDEVTQLRLQP